MTYERLMNELKDISPVERRFVTTSPNGNRFTLIQKLIFVKDVVSEEVEGVEVFATVIERIGADGEPTTAWVTDMLSYNQVIKKIAEKRLTTTVWEEITNAL